MDRAYRLEHASLQSCRYIYTHYTTINNNERGDHCYSNNYCGTSPATTLPVSVAVVPATPGAIIGPTAVCGNTTQLYKIPKVSGATVYAWSSTGNGWLMNQVTPADTFINATVGAANVVISVTASNYCGVSAPQNIAVSVTNTPGNAGSITGPDSVCTGAGAYTYVTGNINEATSYTWSLPTGWTGGGTTQSISVTPGGATGVVTISVAGTNFCGTGPAMQKTVVVNNSVTPMVSLVASPLGSICSGNSITYTATIANGGASPTYQWRVNNVAVGGATASNIFTPSTLINGDVVSVVMHSSAPCAANAGYAVAVAPPAVVIPSIMPGININATLPPNMCKGETVTFYSNVVGQGTSPGYQWWKNGSVIAGVTGTTYTDNTLVDKDTIRVVANF